MATKPFTDALTNASNPTQLTQNSTSWLKKQAIDLNVSHPKDLVTKLSPRLVSQLTVGRMYLYMYDPKMKEELPRYDRFPLIFPFREVSGGFYGINMHYLPFMQRARLMDALLNLVNNNNKDDTTKLLLSYQLLKSVAKVSLFAPCVKHYLNSHVKSRFLWIPASQWEKALFLPLERFVIK